MTQESERERRQHQLGRSRRQIMGRGNQRLATLSVIAMVIIIVEFQGIHEARMQHLKLKQMHEREQSAGESLSGNMGIDLGSQGEQQHPEQDAGAAVQQAGALSSLRQEHPQQEHIAQSKQNVPKTRPRLKSNLDLPNPSTNNNLIPSTLRNLADLSDPYSKELKEMPFFWHLAKSGGTSLKHMYSDCYGLVEACESGVAEGHHRDITLKVVTLESGWKFANVDTTTPMGIERASRLNLARSGKVHVVVSPLPHDVTSKLFLKQNRGRCFTIFRDPIERVVSLFFYLQTASHEPTYNPALQQMTLDEYVNSDLAETNFVSRSLLNKMHAPLSEDDFLVLKEVLRTKCLVGLLDELQESVRRFDLYFGFRELSSPDSTCTEKYLKTGSNRHSHPAVPPLGSPTYQVLQRNNHMDIRLYQYACELFAEQARMFQKESSASLSS